MNARHRERSWSIAPGSWSVEADDDCTTLEPPSRDTALQISAYLKSSGDVTDEDLAEFAADIELLATGPARCGDFRGLCGEHEADGVHWRKWLLCAGPHLLFATYNGDDAASARDRSVVDAMLATLRSEPRSPLN